MAQEKFDGVIEAVRYSPEGAVSQVRMYERRGPTWSDCVLLDRAELDKEILHTILEDTPEEQKALNPNGKCSS